MASLVTALAVTTWSCSGYVADTSIAPGDRVRVTAPSMELNKGVGTVVAVETDALVVDTEERADALEVPLADVTRLQVHRGQRSQVGEGAVIGGLVGVAAGALLGIAGCEFSRSMEGSDQCTYGEGAVLGAVLVGGVSVLVGASLPCEGMNPGTCPLAVVRLAAAFANPCETSHIADIPKGRC